MSAPATIELDAQYRQLREECGLLNRSGRGILLVSGPDGAEYLQGQLTNDIEALEPGDGCRAELLDRKGHIQADLRVLRVAADEILLDTDGVATEPALRHLTMYSIGREVSIRDAGAERAILSLIGPRAEISAGVPRGSEHSWRAAPVAGSDVIAVSTRHGLDLVCRAEDSERVCEEVLAAGAAPVSEEAAEILRIESGVPRFGAEMSRETMPAEAGIVEETVSFTKGCYIGQETVARLHYKGRPNRHLRGLRLSGSATPGEELRLGERTVGRVGSACLSPAFGHIGLAILRREAEPGAALQAAAGSAAEVVGLPFGEEAS